jgi:ribosomal-protein-alanine acetyltransferase
VIRRATLDDLDAIMLLETTLFVNDAWSAEMMAAELTGPHGFYLVAEEAEEAEGRESEAGGVVGYAGLMSPRHAPESDVQTIAVAPSHRRQGLGRQLMLALLAEAVERGARETFLEVRVDNPGAQALYESLGFEGIAVRPRYYMPDGVDALVMKKKLEAAG